MTKANAMLKKCIHPLLLRCVSIKYRRKITIVGSENIPSEKQPVIFAVNHTNGYDFPTTARIIKKHFYVLADYTMQNDSLVNILNRLNGCIYVDRKSKSDRKKAKQTIIQQLISGDSVLMFPEGTWNLHPSRLLLPLNWGIIDISKQAEVPIVPIILLYSDEQIYAKVGAPYKPIFDKNVEIKELETVMATLLWDLMIKVRITARESLPEDPTDSYIQAQLSTYKKFDLAYETSVILKTQRMLDEPFLHLSLLKPDLKTAFLFNKRLTG